MSAESVISLNCLFNDNLQNVEGDISDSTENVHQQSDVNRVSDIDSSVTNGSVNENETKENSASPLMEESEKYVKLNGVLYILCAGVLMLILHTCLSLILAFIYACNAHYWFVSATYATILGSNLFIVSVSRVWKYSKEENIIQIIISSLVSVMTTAELQVYYHDCNRLHKLTLLHRSRSYYKQTLQHVDDLRYLLCMVTALQVVPQFFIQLALICLYGTETCFIRPLQITVMVFASLCVLWAVVTLFSCTYNDELSERYRVSVLDLALTLLSVIFYTVDIGSDVYVVAIFFNSNQCLYAGLTLSFILLPSIYITWFRHDRNVEDLVLVCYLKSMKLIRKVKKIELNEPPNSEYSDERKNCHIKLAEINFNAAILRYNESYTESTMQLILQTAILLGQFKSFPDMFHTDVLRSKWFQMLSIVLSWINLAIPSVTMFRSKRINQYINNEELDEDDPLSWKGMVLQFVGYLLIVIRILAISFAASTFPVITTCLLIGNWMVVFLFITFEPKISPLPYRLGQSVIFTFTPPINTLATEMFFQLLYLLENVLVTIFWAQTQLTPSARCLPIVLIFAFNILGIALRYYYQKNYNVFLKIPVN